MKNLWFFLVVFSLVMGSLFIYFSSMSVFIKKKIITFLRSNWLFLLFLYTTLIKYIGLGDAFTRFSQKNDEAINNSKDELISDAYYNTILQHQDLLDILYIGGNKTEFYEILSKLDAKWVSIILDSDKCKIELGEYIKIRQVLEFDRNKLFGVQYDDYLLNLTQAGPVVDESSDTLSDFGIDISILFSPEIFLGSFIILFIVFGVYTSKEEKKLTSKELNSIYSYITCYILILTFLLLNHEMILEHASFIFNNGFIFKYGNMFYINAMTQNLKKILIFISVICLFMVKDFLEIQRNVYFEFYLLYLMFVLNLMILISSNDFLTFVLGLEGQGLIAYIFAGLKTRSLFSLEAAMKYFIIGSVSSALLFYGISLLYFLTGTTNFYEIQILVFPLFKDPMLADCFIIAFSFILVGLFFKIGAAPFHMWLADVYEGSPTTSTIIFTIIPKIIVFSVFLRFFQPLYDSFFNFFNFIFVMVAIISVFVGSLMAFRQTKLKRLLAYSSVSHVGYLLLGVAANSFNSYNALWGYFLVYILTSIGIWCLILSINTDKTQNRAKTLSDLAYVSKGNPLLGFCAVVLFFSLAGIPPFIGFMVKLELFAAALDSNLIFSTVIVILISIISAFFYVRLLKIIIFEKPNRSDFVYPISKKIAFILVLSVFLVLFFSLNPKLLYLIVNKIFMGFNGLL